MKHMRYALVAAVLIISAAGCASQSQPFGRERGNYEAVIRASRSLPFTDKADILMTLARKRDLNDVDVNLIAEEAGTLPFTDRARVLRALANRDTDEGW